MDIQEFLDSEVGIAVAATALLSSPAVREIARRGLVLVVGGLLSSSEALSSGVERLARGMRPDGSSDGLQDITDRAEREAT